MKNLILLISIILSFNSFSQLKIEGEIINTSNTIAVIYVLYDSSYQEISSNIINKNFQLEVEIGYDYLITFVKDKSFKILLLNAEKSSNQENLIIDFNIENHLFINYNDKINNYILSYLKDDYVRNTILKENTLGKLQL